MVRRILRSVVDGLFRGVALLLLLALLLPTLLVLYTTTDDFRARLLARLGPEIDGRMAGDLSIGGLAGSPFSRLRFVDVSLAWHDEQIARIASVAIEVEWSALLFGHLEVARVDVEAPEILLREHAALGWDWRDALAPLIPAPDQDHPPEQTPRPIFLETVVVSDAVLVIAAQARPPVRLDGLAARGRLDFQQRRLHIEAATLALGQSKLVAAGDVPLRGRFAFDVVIEALHPGDLARLAPALAEALAFLSPATGELILGGDDHSLDATGQLVWPGTQLTFDLHGDPRALGLARSTIVARLESADIARFAPGPGIAGRLDLQLELANGEGSFGARLRSGSRGELSAEGLVSVAGTPETKLQFSAKRFDLASAFPDHPEWAGALEGRGTLALRGRDRSALDGALALTLDASRIGALELRRGLLQARLARETIELGELVLDSRIGHVEASGRLSTRAGGPAALAARVEIGDLAPVLALVGQTGGGRLDGRIAVDGDSERMRLETGLELGDLRIGSFETEAASLSLAARGGFAGDILAATIERARLETTLGVWTLEDETDVQAARDALDWDSARFTSGEASIAVDGRIARRGRQDLRLEARALPIAAWAQAHPEVVSPQIIAGGVLDIDLSIDGIGAAPVVEARLVPRGLVVSKKPIETAEAVLRFADRSAHGTLTATAEPRLRVDAEGTLPFARSWDAGFLARPLGALVAKATCEVDDLAVLQGFVDDRVKALGGHAECELALEGPIDGLRPSGRIEAADLTGRPVRTGITVVSGELAVEIAADRFFVRRATASVKGYEKTARFRASGEGPLPSVLTQLIRTAPEVSEPLESLESGAQAAPSANGDYTTQIELVRWPLVDTRRDRLIASGRLRARGSFETPASKAGSRSTKASCARISPSSRAGRRRGTRRSSSRVKDPNRTASRTAHPE